LKIPSILWQGNRASKIKRLLAGYDIHFPWQVLISYTSALPTAPTLYSQLQHGLGKRPTLSNSVLISHKIFFILGKVCSL
jgi:hypothetical protein